MKRSLLLAVGLMLSVTALPRANAQNDREARVPNLTTIFWGIVGHARWPDEKKPLRICVPGEDRRTTQIRQSAGAFVYEIITVPSLTSTNTCDVVYAYNINMVETSSFLRSLAGSHAVLTIGEGAAFCTAGGMFCLLPKGNSGEAVFDRFAVNLDAISRSSLRIDPQVLRLSKRRQEPK